MNLVDSAASWNPVPDDRPARAWLPSQRTDPTTRSQAAAVAATRRPQPITLSVTPQQAANLPLWLGQLLAQQVVRPGDRVTIDLADVPSVHVPGLALLMTALWRRVGADGEVLHAGGTPGLRAQLASLQVTPASARATVRGFPPAAASAPGPVPAPIETGFVATPAVLQRQPPEPAPGRPRLTLGGDVNLTVDLRIQARLNALLSEPRTRTLTIDLGGVTSLSLSSLRLLLDIDRRLRARGGRLRLLHPNAQVQRLLAITRSDYLAEDQRTPAPPAAPPQRPGPVTAAAESERAASSRRVRRRRSHSRRATAPQAAAGGAP